MDNYIGMYVKRFESGTRGSLALSSCGNDWGLSCGSYQLTLRWGNCISFLKTYFKNESRQLYFNTDKKDITRKDYPGPEYCSSPAIVKSVWMKCYNKVGAEKFFEYEHEYMKINFYDKLINKIETNLGININSMNDRAYQECFWSWAIHKGVSGAYKTFASIVDYLNTDIKYVDRKELFDLIYDIRYELDKFNRYKSGPTDGSSEREVLRQFLTDGTISGEKKPEPVIPKYNILKKEGSIKIIYKGKDGINIRLQPTLDSEIDSVVMYGQQLDIVGIVEDRDFYKISNGLYITSNTKYVQFIEKPDESLYKIRVLVPELEIKKEPNDSSDNNGYVSKNQIFTIVEESNGYGKLKSGAGWISLNASYIKKFE